MENNGGREEPKPEPDSLFHTVREFLKQEEQTYGRFQIPELPDVPPLSSTTGTPAESGEEKSLPATDTNMIQEDSEAGPAAAKSLEELFEICLAADALRTDLADTRLVFGTGNPNADLMLIGEAPGLQEDRQGEPFVGKAGQLLNKILAAISFRREDVYIANILKHRPPNNRDPLPEERDRSLPYLYRQIELIQPKLILCLGRVSAQTLLNTSEPMKNLRSRFHPFHDGIQLLVTFHPAALLRNPAWKRDTWEDVQLLRKRYDELTGSSR
ncbi:MAG: uracil-DNA glycosylase [Balneolaceae bacterium]|nr:MAG: uracil-DNA glycosylase [Balneolaceae bacterium]